MENEVNQNIFINNSQLVEKEHFDKYLNYNEGVIIYEVIRMINGIPLFFDEHLMRLHYSANLAGYCIRMNDSEITHSIKQLSIENQVFNGNIKLVFQFLNDKLSSFYCFFIKHSYPTELQYKNGVKVKFFPIERQNPNAKIVNSEYRNKTEEFVRENLIYEALLINKNGWITEGSKSNVFFIKNNFIFTAPKSMILSGITRQYVLKAANLRFVDVVEECVNQKDIGIYDAVFISGTSPKILPVSSIENINYNVEHPILLKIMSDYNDEITNYLDKNSLK